MNAILDDRPRSCRSGKSERQNSSASGTLPTSRATWLIPIARAIRELQRGPRGAIPGPCVGVRREAHASRMPRRRGASYLAVQTQRAVANRRVFPYLALVTLGLG